MRAYAEIIPQGAERIYEMAEREQRFRHEIILAREKRASAGVIFAFLLGAGAIALAAYGLFLGQGAAACVVFVTTIAAIAEFSFTEPQPTKKSRANKSNPTEKSRVPPV